MQNKASHGDVECLTLNVLCSFVDQEINDNPLPSWFSGSSDFAKWSRSGRLSGDPPGFVRVWCQPSLRVEGSKVESI